MGKSISFPSKNKAFRTEAKRGMFIVKDLKSSTIKMCLEHWTVLLINMNL